MVQKTKNKKTIKIQLGLGRGLLKVRSLFSAGINEITTIMPRH